MKPTSLKSFFPFKIFILVELLLALYFINLALIFKTPIPAIIQQLLAGYHFPYTNSCTVGNLLGMNIHLHLILFIVIFFILYNSWRRLSPPFPAAPASPWEILPAAGLALLTFLLTLQTINHVKIFANERRLFSGKTVSEKQRFIHKQPYEFALFCRQQYPGRHKGFLRTDLDPHNEPFATQHRKLVYFLFPDIDIRNAYRAQPYDCLVFYEEKNGLQNIPPGFKIKGILDNRHFLAVKEGQE